MTRRTVRVKEKQYVYLTCVENKNKRCSFHKTISLPAFEDAVLSIINLHIENVFELSKMLKLAQEVPYQGYLAEKLYETIADKKLVMEKKKHYSMEIYEDYKDGVITDEEYRELKAAFRMQIEALGTEISSLEQEIEQLAESRKDRVQWVNQFIECRGFGQLTREVLLKLVEEIRIFDKDRIEVVFRYQPEYEEACRYVHDKKEKGLTGQKEEGHCGEEK